MNLLACYDHVLSVTSCYLNLLMFVTWFLEFVHCLYPEKDHTAAGGLCVPALRLKRTKVESKSCSQSGTSAYLLRIRGCQQEIQLAASAY